MREASKWFADEGWPQAIMIVVVVVLGLWSYGQSARPLPAPRASGSPVLGLAAPKQATPAAEAVAMPPAPDCARVACLALTFDDGPNPTATPLVLDALARHHVHATFFVIGLHVPGNEGLLRRMYREGHEIGNHSWGHLDMTKLSPEQIEQQVFDTQAVVAGAGVPAPRLFRPPYGAVNQVVRSNVPLTIALWNVDPEDWHAKQPQQIIDQVKAQARPGRIIDLHDIYPQTAEALDTLLTDLQQTYQLVTVSDLLNLAPGQPGTFYGR